MISDAAGRPAAADRDRTVFTTLFALTFVTGVIDAASFLGMGHIFTANMTGNVVFLGFALAGAPGLSVARGAMALAGFVTGALLGGRLHAASPARSPAGQIVHACMAEAILLGVAALVATAIAPDEPQLSGPAAGVIVLTALAMGLRNATVRVVAVADMTTTVLTLTITGLAADSRFAGGDNPRWPRRLGSVLAMAAGAALGVALLRHGLASPLAFSAVVSGASALALRFGPGSRVAAP